MLNRQIFINMQNIPINLVFRTDLLDIDLTKVLPFAVPSLGAHELDTVEIGVTDLLNNIKCNIEDQVKA